jgi:hypothetical protein
MKFKIGDKVKVIGNKSLHRLSDEFTNKINEIASIHTCIKCYCLVGDSTVYYILEEDLERA